ncbi:MAG: hypothetical protein KDM91_13060 [Verrucomicrobiae bacterium]|nr:hypothetical protein [Verrucomicrobiae bacterium]MCP5540477.1 hypothetical protein [Akkermansiaceae bacterium]
METDSIRTGTGGGSFEVISHPATQNRTGTAANMKNPFIVCPLSAPTMPQIGGLATENQETMMF